MNQHLYNDILSALTDAKNLGVIEAQAADEAISEREAVRRFGQKTVDKYIDKFGLPERTGGKTNSKRLYKVPKLASIVASEKITEKVQDFEVKVRRHQRLLDGTVKTYTETFKI